ncbi:MAG: ROK family protein [Chloroflexia bacterium]|nr:ROK family protein [Chloroflexia bacterium]
MQKHTSGRASLLGLGGYLLGVDIGGYGLQVALANVQGELLQTQQQPLDRGSEASEVVLSALEMCRRLLHESEIRPEQLIRAGIGFGGPVDAAAGVTIVSHRMPGWENYPLRQVFEDNFDIVTLVDNDARVTALGEATYGAGQGVRDLFYIHLSSGVGGGLVLDGQIYRGATTTAGEIGHTLILEDGPLCSCGRRGHLEALVSAPALIARAQELSRDDPGPLQAWAQENVRGLRFHHVVEAARQGHAPCRQVLVEATHYLALAVSNLVNVINPELVVLGGVVARVAGPDLLEPLQQEVRSLAMPVPGQAVRIVPGKLGETSVVVGAIALARHSLEE